jgi:hypothetical protein
MVVFMLAGKKVVAGGLVSPSQSRAARPSTGMIFTPDFYRL